MPVIHIYGASGSGTSTLAKAIKDKYHYKMLDTDDYFWLPTDPPFTHKRPLENRIKLINDDMFNQNKVVISGSLCGWGDALIPSFDLVIRLITPTNIRIERIKKREFLRFGNRINKDGDMFLEHTNFLEWASEYDTGDVNMRSKAAHDLWQAKMPCKHMLSDGTKQTDMIIDEVNSIYAL